MKRKLTLSILLIFSLMFFKAPTFPPISAQEPVIVNVLVDEAHGYNREWIPGEISTMAAYLNHYDFNVTSVYEGELTQEILSNYEILVVMFFQ